MRPERRAADRAHAVRSAAARWAGAGAIDAAAHAAIDRAFADDHLRLKPALRALLFILTVVAVSGALGFLTLLFLAPAHGEKPYSAFYLVCAALLAALTEGLTRGKRLFGAGAEEATALMALGCLAVGTVLAVLSRSDSSRDVLGLRLAALALAAGAALAVWRWGMAWAGAVAAASLLGLLLASPQGRLWWLVAGAALGPWLLELGRAGSPSPTQRLALRAAGVVFLAAFYLAFNLRSFDGAWLEVIARRLREAPGELGLARWLAIAGTVLVPPACLWLGLRRRDRLWLAAGVLFATASLATARSYWPILPLWLTLLAGGLAALGLALGLRRWLAAGPDRARGGWTAEPLFEDEEERSAAEIAAGLLTLSPTARPPEPTAGFEGKGGHFGGGGAESSF